MKKETKESVSKMRGLILQILDISRSMPEEEWISLILALRRDKERLRTLKNMAEIGNIFIFLWFVREYFEKILNEDEMMQNS